MNLSLDEVDVERIARRVVDLLAERDDSQPDRWLNTREAGVYLGLSVHAMHRLTAAREVRFSQDGRGARCFFKRSDLDAWRDSNLA